MIDFDGLPLIPASVKRHRGSISRGILAHDTRVHVVTTHLRPPLETRHYRQPRPPRARDLLFDEARELMAAILGADIATGPTSGLHYMTGAEIPFIDGKWILTPDDMA